MKLLSCTPRSTPNGTAKVTINTSTQYKCNTSASADPTNSATTTKERNDNRIKIRPVYRHSQWQPPSKFAEDVVTRQFNVLADALKDNASLVESEISAKERESLSPS
ncbi:hypothetical protein RB195_021919 [Necator americanus]|uniref:Uncharacterized protein n=1 Tax=Necator americanus TaxID=51031 RepID=A0ABR1EDA4_NECAM